MSVTASLREKRGRIVGDARAILAKPRLTAEDNAKFDALMDEESALKARIDRIELADSLDKEVYADLDARARAARRSVDAQHAEDEAHARAFNKFMRQGAARLDAAEHKILTARQPIDFHNALGVGTGAAGGFTVPAQFYKTLIAAQLAYGGMLKEATVIDTEGGGSLPVPTSNDTGTSGILLSENSLVTPVDPTFGQIPMGAYTFSSQAVLVSVQLLQDSAFDLGAFLVEQQAIRIARGANPYFTTGTGSSQPMGVVTAATSGTLGTTGQTTSIIYDDLVNLEHSVDPAYRVGAKFMMNDATLKVIKKLKDTAGRPLWAPGLVEDTPDTISGYPYVINPAMPVMAASAKSIVFGNLRNYYIRRVNSAIALRMSQRYVDYAQVGFVLLQRFDGNLVNAGTNPIKYYQNSAT